MNSIYFYNAEECHNIHSYYSLKVFILFAILYIAKLIDKICHAILDQNQKNNS